MSTKAGTAALDPVIQRPLLLQRRIPRHPAGGLLNFMKAEETKMNVQTSIATQMRSSMMSRSIRRRLLGAVLLVAFTLVAPVIGAAAPVTYKEVRVSKIDRRAMENLQRWVNDGHDQWCKDAQLVASAEMQRIAPDFAGYQFDLASLPLEKEAHEKDKAVFRYTSFDGRVTYRVTLQRYAWLLPIAGEQKSIVWAPARVEIVTNN